MSSHWLLLKLLAKFPGQKDIDDWKALCERKEAAASAQNNNAAADDDDDNEDKYESADEEIFSGNGAYLDTEGFIVKLLLFARSINLKRYAHIFF